jgi:hypothetical protein
MLYPPEAGTHGRTVPSEPLPVRDCRLKISSVCLPLGLQQRLILTESLLGLKPDSVDAAQAITKQ